MKATDVRCIQGHYKRLRLHASEHTFADGRVVYGAKLYSSKSYREFAPVPVGAPSSLQECWDNAVSWLQSIDREGM